MSKAMPGSMMELFGQQVGNQADQGGDDQGGNDVFQNGRDALYGMSQMGSGQGMMGMMGGYAHGGAVEDALHAIREHFRRGGHPQQVGGYNFHPQFANDRDALIRAIYAEAGNQGVDGQLKVGMNIRNRADANYHDNGGIQGQILANKQYSSFNANQPETNIAGRRAMALDPNGEQYRKVGDVADRVLGRIEQDPTMGASHYYAPGGMKGGLPPKWIHDQGMQYLGQEGAHKFYQSAGFNPQQPATPMQMGDQNALAMNRVGGLGDLSSAPQTGFGAGSTMTLPPAIANAQPPAPQMNVPLPPMRPQMGPPMPMGNNLPPIGTPGGNNLPTQMNAPNFHNSMGPEMPQPQMAMNAPMPPMRPDHFGPMVNAPQPPERPEFLTPSYSMAPPTRPEMGPQGPASHANVGPRMDEMGWKPPAEIADRAPNAIIEGPHDAPNAPTPPMTSELPQDLTPVDLGGVSMAEGPSFDDVFSGLFNRGGRAGFSLGGDAQEDQSQYLPMMARAHEAAQMAALDRSESRPSSNASDFVAHELRADGQQLPQSNEAEGWRTGERAGLMAAGFAPGSGAASAAGYFPSVDHESGFEPSMKQNIHEGNYGTAALQGLGALGDAAYAIPGVGTMVGGALKAPMAMKMAMALPAAAKVGREAAPVLEGAVEAAPQFEHLINPAGMASRGYEYASTALPKKATWQEMQKLLTDPQKGQVTPEEMYWANFDYAPTDKVTAEDIAAKFKRNYPQVESYDYGRGNDELEAAIARRDDADVARSAAMRAYGDRAMELIDPETSPYSWRPPSQPLGGNLIPTRQGAAMMFAENGYDPASISEHFPHIIRGEARVLHDSVRDAEAAQRELDALAAQYENVRQPKWEAYTTGNDPNYSYDNKFGQGYGVSAMTVPTREKMYNVVPSEEASAPFMDEWQGHIDNIAKLRLEMQAATKARDDAMERALSGEDSHPNAFGFEAEPEFNPPRTISELTEHLASRGRPLTSTADLESQVDSINRGPMATRAIAESRASQQSPVQQAEAEMRRISKEIYAAEEAQNALHRKMVNRQIELNKAKDPEWILDASDGYAHETHLPGANNPVGHVRYKYAKDDNGKYMLFEESQSDMGQQGREEGFIDPKQMAELNRLSDERWMLDQIWSERQDALRSEYFGKRNPLVDAREAKMQELLGDQPNDQRRYMEALSHPDVKVHDAQLEAASTAYSDQLAEARRTYETTRDKLTAQIDAIPQQGTVHRQPYAAKTELWNELLVKRSLQEAMARGQRRIFIPGGQEHARRYMGQIRQQVKDVSWRSSEDGFVRAYMTPDEAAIRGVNIPEGERIRVNFGADGIIQGSNVRAFEGQKAEKVFGKALVKRMREERTDHIDFGDEGTILGADGYAEHYERNTPKAFAKVMKPFDKNAKIERGSIDVKGKKVAGTWVNLSDDFVNNYNKAMQERGFAFYGYKKGGRVGFAYGGASDLPSMAQEDPEQHIADAMRYAKVAEGERLREDAQKPMNPGLQTALDYATYSMAQPDTSPQKAIKGMVDIPESAKNHVQGAWDDAKQAGNYFADTMSGRREMDPTSEDARRAGMTIAGMTTLGAGAMEAPAGALTAGAARRGKGAIEDATQAAKSSIITPAAPSIIRPQEIPTTTIRQILEGNGYHDIPGKASFSGALDLPAKTRTWGEIGNRMNSALHEYYKMSEKERDIANAKAAVRLEPYLQKSDGSLADLLTQNGKTIKSQKNIERGEDGRGIETWGMGFTPALQWGVGGKGLNFCGNHAICVDDCLGVTGGRYAMNGTHNNRFAYNDARGRGLAKSIAMMMEPESYALYYDQNIKERLSAARKQGNSLGIRSNVLSDIHPVVWSGIRKYNPGVTHYDYTKHGGYRATDPNHHLTYSSTGWSTPPILDADGEPISSGVVNRHSNWTGHNGMREALDRGDNVTVVVSQKNKLPSNLHDAETGVTYEGTSGDEHDFRPLDKAPPGERGKVVFLGRKGNKHTAASAHEGSEGFIVPYDPKTMGDTVTVPDQRQFKRKSGGSVPQRCADEEIFYNHFPNHADFVEAEPIMGNFGNPKRKRG